MRQLNIRESFRLLKQFDIPFTHPTYIHDPRHLEHIRTFPCVMKINSEQIVHKSDVGGIKVGINDKHELIKAYHDMMKQVRKHEPKARLHGVTLFRQEKGTEIFLGMKHDEQFGNVFAFGLGGIFVEVLKDVSLRISPFTKKEARNMIHEINSHKIFQGVRGQKPVDETRLIDIIMKTQKLCNKHKHIKELDFNPIIAGKNTLVADVRIIVEQVRA